jgi:hypothetical protein
MSLAFGDLIYPLVPVGFALLSSFPGEAQYLDNQANKLCDDQSLGQNAKQYVAAIAKSAVVVHGHFETITSGVLSLIITLHVWPPGWRYVAAVVIAFFFLLHLRKWVYQIFALDLYRIVTDSPPASGGVRFASHTYADEIRRRRMGFNLCCAGSILIGWFWAQGVLLSALSWVMDVIIH